jgi:hypothetical protein
MRHVSGFSNSTRIRFIIDGFGMYATINDVLQKQPQYRMVRLCDMLWSIWQKFVVVVQFWAKAVQWAP